MTNRNALIIIAKHPEKGAVKTRIKGLSDEERVKLYTRLLHYTMQNLSSIPGVDTLIAFAPANREEYFLQFNVKLIPLERGDLGTRMYQAFKHVFRAGYQKASLVGADIPDLTAGIIQDSFNFLSDNDLVFGPAKDGGYYLIGMSKLIKEVFEGVPWSSDQTLNQSLIKAGRSGYPVGFTETLSDIDTIDDVKKANLVL